MRNVVSDDKRNDFAIRADKGWLLANRPMEGISLLKIAFAKAQDSWAVSEDQRLNWQREFLDDHGGNSIHGERTRCSLQLDGSCARVLCKRRR